jgi:predicted nucleic acid-binding protein
MWAQAPPAWVKVQAPATLDKSLNVDEGEREAICLAREVKATAILMDDKKGRAEAVRYGLRVAGTIGVLEAAAQRGLFDFSTAIQRLRQTNAWLDEGVTQAALARRPVK